MSEEKRVNGFDCPKCHWSDVFAVTVCPHCGTPLEEAWFSGQGKVVTFTQIRYPPKGFESEAPYIVAMIDLENGPRVLARIVRGSVDPQIGQSVSFVAAPNGFLEFKIRD
jgi:hypothetical protein